MTKTPPTDNYPEAGCSSPLRPELSSVLRALKRQSDPVRAERLTSLLKTSTQTGVNERLRRLLAYGAVRRVPSPGGDSERYWEITLHGIWMLESGVAVRAADRPRGSADMKTPPRTFVNSTVLARYEPCDQFVPRAGSMRAFSLPSVGIDGVARA